MAEPRCVYQQATWALTRYVKLHSGGQRADGVIRGVGGRQRRRLCHDRGQAARASDLTPPAWQGGDAWYAWWQGWKTKKAHGRHEREDETRA